MPILQHRKPSLLSYPMWAASRALLRPTLSLWPLNAPGMAGLFLIDRAFAIGPTPSGVVRESMTLAERPVELLMPSGPSRRDHDTAILYLHGGAFLVCGLGSHRSIAGRMARECGLPVFSLAYRQLPKAGVGTSVADALAAYRELIVERGYRRVVVAGDSAGGFLAGKLVEAADGAGLPRPAVIIGISPLLDLDVGTNADRSSRSDAYIPQKKMAELETKFDRGPVPFTGVRRIADVAGPDFPPTVIITAEAEMLEADCIEFVELLEREDVDVVLHSYAWQVHAFPVLTTGHPETVSAMTEIVDFTARAIREAKDADERKDKRAG